MDLVILANAWSAAADNPTSKHQIALELARQGHRVLWIEGAGMRRPSAASARDRARAWRKIVAAWRGPERQGVRCQVSGVKCLPRVSRGQRSEVRDQPPSPHATASQGSQKQTTMCRVQVKNDPRSGRS